MTNCLRTISLQKLTGSSQSFETTDVESTDADNVSFRSRSTLSSHRGSKMSLGSIQSDISPSQSGFGSTSLDTVSHDLAMSTGELDIESNIPTVYQPLNNLCNLRKLAMDLNMHFLHLYMQNHDQDTTTLTLMHRMYLTLAKKLNGQISGQDSSQFQQPTGTAPKKTGPEAEKIQVAQDARSTSRS